ncbi:MAG: DUF374 domain-containing protein [Candidatus Krumholzibacteriia bacterium]
MGAGQALKLACAPPLWRLLRRTVRLVPPAPPAGAGPRIFACLHRDILPAILHVRSCRPVLMVSSSPDGDILVRTLGEDEFGFVRGSGEEHGSRAFLSLCRLVEDGRSAGLAVDGPKGPYGIVRDGVLHLARRTGAPIVPLRAEARGALVLRTWDRTVVPLPGGRVTVTAGQPLALARDADSAALAGVRARLGAFFGVAAGEP